MKITQIQNTNINKKQSNTKQVAFKGVQKMATDTADVVKDTAITKASIWIKNVGGEKLANIVNAASKGLVAPLVIALNPLSKEDKETRVYSAWKQPIEAAITITIQLLALNNTDKYFDKLSANGLLAKETNLKGLKEGTPEFLEAAKKLDVFKSRMGFFVALAVIPVATSLVNWAYPKLMRKIQPQAYAKSGGEE